DRGTNRTGGPLFPNRRSGPFSIMTDTPTPAISTARPEDFFQLLKPRVMSLVVFTAVTGLVAAPGAMNLGLAAISVLCIAVGAGAAGALNMALEGETDAL